MTWFFAIVITALFLLLGLLYSEAQDAVVARRDVEEKLQAATWLAEYHAAYTHALQDYALEREPSINLPTLHMRLRRYRQAAQNAQVALCLPMQDVPHQLRHAAILFNADAKSRWPPSYRDFDDGYLRMMEYLARMGHVHLQERYTECLVRKFPNVSAATMMGILDELELRLSTRVHRLQEQPDNEEVLPQQQ